MITPEVQQEIQRSFQFRFDAIQSLGDVNDQTFENIKQEMANDLWGLDLGDKIDLSDKELEEYKEELKECIQEL